MRDVDLYFNTPDDVSRYHSDPTNAYFDGETVCMYPRAIHCLFTRTISDVVPVRSGNIYALRKKYAKMFGLLPHMRHIAIIRQALECGEYDETRMISYDPPLIEDMRRVFKKGHGRRCW